MNEFKDKTAVVTGGASGIGRALGELFLARGMNVVLADIEQSALDATVAALAAAGGNCIGVVTDVSRAEDVQKLADTALAEFGVIHGIRTFVPIMAAQDSECHIVNTASMAAVTAMPYSGIYHMTKHAVLSVSESLYHELAFHVPNVKVSVLCPEAINTGIAASERNRPESYSRDGDIVASDARSLVSQALAESVASGLGSVC